MDGGECVVWLPPVAPPVRSRSERRRASQQRRKVWVVGPDVCRDVAKHLGCRAAIPADAWCAGGSSARRPAARCRGWRRAAQAAARDAATRARLPPSRARRPTVFPDCRAPAGRVPALSRASAASKRADAGIEPERDDDRLLQSFGVRRSLQFDEPAALAEAIDHGRRAAASRVSVVLPMPAPPSTSTAVPSRSSSQRLDN